MNGSTFDEDEEEMDDIPEIPSKDGICSMCGDPVEDCICDEVLPQYQPMQTDDGAVDHCTPTHMECMDQSRYYRSKGWI